MQPRGPPILPMYKVNASKSRKKGGGIVSIVIAILLPVMVVSLLVFFFLSIYMGSYYLQQHLQDESPSGLLNSIGLPNTRNLIQKWSIANLRGLDITKLGPPPKTVPQGLLFPHSANNSYAHYLSTATAAAGNWTGSIHPQAMKELALKVGGRLGQFYHNSSLTAKSRVNSIGSNSNSSYSEHIHHWLSNHSPSELTNKLNSSAIAAYLAQQSSAAANKANSFRGSQKRTPTQ